MALIGGLGGRGCLYRGGAGRGGGGGGEGGFRMWLGAKAAGNQGCVGAGNRGFKGRGRGEDEVGGHTAVGPATDAELFRIGDALGDSVVDHGHVVLEVL